MGSPILFRRWAAISTLASIMERRCWMVSDKGRLFPNLFVFLIGPPATGKSVALDLSRDLLRAAGTSVAPTNTTRAGLADRLKSSSRQVPGSEETYNSLAIAATELGVLIPKFDPEFMALLTDLWDCKTYEEQKRGSGSGGAINHVIPAAQLSMLAACTPSWMGSTLPPVAWDQGFLSRVICVFSGEDTSSPLFAEPGGPMKEASTPNYDPLLADLKRAATLSGKFEWTLGSQEAAREWFLGGMAPRPDHTRLVHYCGRRLAILAKLAMVASLDRGEDLTIEVEDFARALDWMLEAEHWMPDIFKAMGGSTSDSKAVEDCYNMIFGLWARHKKPVRKDVVIAFLRDRVPLHSVGRALEVMLSSSMVETQDGGKTFQPLAKQLHKEH